MWRALMVSFSLINLVLLGMWQRGQISTFLGEWGQIYDEVHFPPAKICDLSIILYGPTMLVETASSHATVLLRNDGTETLHDIRLALVSQDGGIRVSGGDPTPNSLYVAQLSPGAVHEQSFALTTVRALSSTVNPALDLEVSYNSGGSAPKRVESQHITDACTFKMSEFADLHTTLARWLRVGEGGASTLERLSTVLAMFAGALGGFIAAVTAFLIKPSRSGINWLVSWIRSPTSVAKRRQEKESV
jgi:hypothetical protein